MKRIAHVGFLPVVVAIFCLGSIVPAHSASLILNGGFESGFASWTIADQLGSEGTFFLQTGTASPLNGDPVPAPPGGLNAAMTDAFGPGSHVLYQDFVVPAVPVPGAPLSFDLFLGNRADRFVAPASGTLDFSTPALNQQARVDIMLASSDPFSVAAADVLLNLYKTKTGDPLVSGYNHFSLDLSSLWNLNLGQTLRLRFAETDNLAQFQLGVDNVRFEAVPEPASFLLLGTGLAALLASRRRS